MNKPTLIAISAALLVLVSVSVAAHHSHTMFDDQKVVTLSGTVKEFQYTNPHSWLIVDVENDDGTTTTWGFEAEGPSTLIRAGIRRADFSPGTRVTIEGNPMRDGRPAAMWLRAVREEDGKEFDPREGFQVR